MSSNDIIHTLPTAATPTDVLSSVGLQQHDQQQQQQQNQHQHEQQGQHPTTICRGLSNISEPNTYAGILGTTSNLVNSIVGAGIIGIPYALKESGMIAGIVLLIGVGWMTNKSLRMMIDTACYHPKLSNRGVLTYEDLMYIPFGRWGSIFILTSMFVTAYGAMVAYLIIIKDTVPTIFGIHGHGFVEREFIMFATSLIIILPLAMLRDMANLSFTSMLSVTADCILVLFIAIFAPIQTSVSDAEGLGNVIVNSVISTRVFIGLGIISVAMACQHSAFIVSGSLENKTSSRWGLVTMQALLFSTILCITMGVVGYLGFLDHTQGDILNNFQGMDPKLEQGQEQEEQPMQQEEDVGVVHYAYAANGARALLAITMFFTYPMESFVARHVLCQIFFNGNMDGDYIDETTNVHVPSSKFLGCLGRRETLTLLLYIATLIPALIVDDLGPVLSITGSIGATCLSYIGPGVMYLGINGDAFLTYVAEQLQNSSYKTKNTTTTTTTTTTHSSAEHTTGIELPVVGDVNATMQTTSDPNNPSSLSSSLSSLTLQGSKPWWWWIFGFPIWVSIAQTGSIGTRMTLEKLERDHGPTQPPPPPPPPPPQTTTTTENIGPCVRDYYIAMIFIVFGVIAGFVGVVSNIIVQVNHIFF